MSSNDIDLSEVVTLIVSETKPEYPNKYHDFECCQWTRGIDTLLSRYEEDREEVTSMIESDPNKLIETIWKSDGPLAIDNECRCQMGNGEKRSSFACAQCNNLRRIIDFRLGGVERPFQIECGKEVGNNLIISRTDITTPFLLWDGDSAIRVKNYLQQYNDITICGTANINNLRHITGDTFTIRTLIIWMLAKIFSEKGLPHIPTLHTAFICRGIGYSLYDMPSIGTLSELHKIQAYHNVSNNSSPKAPQGSIKISIVRTIIIQLLVTLRELSIVNFSHGTPSIHGIIFTKDPVSYMYDGVHVEGPITLKISDMWNSSATFAQTHFFPKNIQSSMYIERNMFVPQIYTKIVSMAHCYDIGAINNTSVDDYQTIACPSTMTTCPDADTYDVCKARNVTLYRLTNSTIDIYTAIRHIGVPLYVGSFDFYCFMVSLMCDKSFHYTVTNDQNLYRLWSMIWLIDDLHNIERLIKQVHDVEARGETPTSNRSASNMVINIIRGAWLRCDIVEYLWGLIKLGW